jgi:hypothetical protein
MLMRQVSHGVTVSAALVLLASAAEAFDGFGFRCVR